MIEEIHGSAASGGDPEPIGDKPTPPPADPDPLGDGDSALRTEVRVDREAA